MQEFEIRQFLIDFGVNEHCKGFDYAIELVKLVLKDNNIKNKDIIYYISEKENVSPNTVRETLRYAITLTNKYGGRLTIKNLIKQALQKQKERNFYETN